MVRPLKKKSKEACFGAIRWIGVVDFGGRIRGGSGVWLVSRCFSSSLGGDFFDLAEGMGDNLAV